MAPAALAVLGILAAVQAVEPAGADPTIKSWIEGGGDDVGLGGTLVLHVVVTRRPGDRVLLPADTSFGTLDLVDKKLETRERKDGRVVDDYRLTLIALVPGETQIPALSFGGVLEGGRVIHIDTPARRIVVKDPTAGAKDEAPRENAPVVDVYQEDYTLLYVLGAILGAGLIAFLVRYMLRNWDRWHPVAALALPPPRPPEDVALEKLQALRARGWPEARAKKGWYIELSEIIREYVGGRYGFDGLESTTEEIIRVMRGRKTAGLTQAELFRFLNDCDMVKFARYVPPESEDETALGEAFRIVQVTTPARPAPDRVTGAGGDT